MAAMEKIPQHEFVPIEFQAFAYANIPLPTGFNKTTWRLTGGKNDI
jgi:protein-L-isoaspartate(D-aspartate) O-methyltransferase